MPIDAGHRLLLFVPVGGILVLFSGMGSFLDLLGWMLAFASGLLALLLARKEDLIFDMYMSSSEYIPLRTRASIALISFVASIVLTVFTLVVG